MNARDQDPLKAAHHFAQAAERFTWARSPKESANALLALKFINDRPLLLAAMGHQGAVSGAAYSADGTRVLTWSRDGTARLWDARTGAALVPPLKHNGWVLGAALSANGTRVLTWSEDGTARLSDIAIDQEWPAHEDRAEGRGGDRHHPHRER